MRDDGRPSGLVELEDPVVWQGGNGVAEDGSDRATHEGRMRGGSADVRWKKGLERDASNKRKKVSSLREENDSEGGDWETREGANR